VVIECAVQLTEFVAMGNVASLRLKSVLTEDAVLVDLPAVEITVVLLVQNAVATQTAVDQLNNVAMVNADSHQ